MSSMFHDIQPAVKKETKRVAGITATGTLVMWIVFLHSTWECRKKFLLITQ